MQSTDVDLPVVPAAMMIETPAHFGGRRLSYELHAVIAEAGLLTSAAAAVPSARTAPLRHGLALLPVTDVLYEALGGDATGAHPGFRQLPGGLAGLLAEWSKAGPVAYVESEYFGGVGEENAAVWRDGRPALGPLHLAEGESAPAEGSPVARALRALGIRALGSRDEFDVVGLGRHRDHEDRPGPGAVEG
jgi:hypothetical protein